MSLSFSYVLPDPGLRQSALRATAVQARQPLLSELSEPSEGKTIPLLSKVREAAGWSAGWSHGPAGLPLTAGVTPHCGHWLRLAQVGPWQAHGDSAPVPRCSSPLLASEAIKETAAKELPGA